MDMPRSCVVLSMFLTFCITDQSDDISKHHSIILLSLSSTSSSPSSSSSSPSVSLSSSSSQQFHSPSNSFTTPLSQPSTIPLLLPRTTTNEITVVNYNDHHHHHHQYHNNQNLVVVTRGHNDLPVNISKETDNKSTVNFELESECKGFFTGNIRSMIAEENNPLATHLYHDLTGDPFEVETNASSEFIHVNKTDQLESMTYDVTNNSERFLLQPYDLGDGDDDNDGSDNDDEDDEDYGYNEINKTLYSNYLDVNKNYLSYIDDLNQVTGDWNEDTAIIISASFNFLLFIFSSLGNCLVVFTMLMDKRWHSTISLFLLSLAVADLIFLMVCLPYEMTIRYAFRWTGSRLMCKLAGFVEMLVACTSVFNLVAVSIERYTVIVHPIKSKIWCSKGRTQKIILSIWMAAAILSIPMFFVMDTTSMAYFNNKDTVIILTCAERDIPTPARVALAWYQLTIMFLLPAAILAFCYSQVISALWTSTKRLYRIGYSSSLDDQPGNLAHHHHHHSMKNKTEQNMSCPTDIKEIRKQIIKMLLIVVLIFFICWGPKQIILILKRHKPEILQSDEVFYVMLLFNSLPYVQSLANPFIYCFMSKNFRRSLRGAFKRLMRKCRSCCRHCREEEEIKNRHKNGCRNVRKFKQIQQQGRLEVGAVACDDDILPKERPTNQYQQKRRQTSLCQNFKKCRGEADSTSGDRAGEGLSPGITDNTPENPALHTEVANVDTVTRSDGTAERKNQFGRGINGSKKIYSATC